MTSFEIVQSEYHPNGRGAPFYAAIIDDATTGDVKLVIMFDEPDYTAVISLDALLQDEDISVERNGWRGEKYDEALRDYLWTTDTDDY